jgi:hypothetical protein
MILSIGSQGDERLAQSLAQIFARRGCENVDAHPTSLLERFQSDAFSRVCDNPTPGRTPVQFSNPNEALRFNRLEYRIPCPNGFHICLSVSFIARNIDKAEYPQDYANFLNQVSSPEDVASIDAYTGAMTCVCLFDILEKK